MAFFKNLNYRKGISFAAEHKLHELGPEAKRQIIQIETKSGYVLRIFPGFRALKIKHRYKFVRKRKKIFKKFALSILKKLFGLNKSFYINEEFKDHLQYPELFEILYILEKFYEKTLYLVSIFSSSYSDFLKFFFVYNSRTFKKSLTEFKTAVSSKLRGFEVNSYRIGRYTSKRWWRVRRYKTLLASVLKKLNEDRRLVLPEKRLHNSLVLDKRFLINFNRLFHFHDYYDERFFKKFLTLHFIKRIFKPSLIFFKSKSLKYASKIRIFFRSLINKLKRKKKDSIPLTIYVDCNEDNKLFINVFRKEKLIISMRADDVTEKTKRKSRKPHAVKLAKVLLFFLNFFFEEKKLKLKNFRKFKLFFIFSTTFIGNNLYNFITVFFRTAKSYNKYLINRRLKVHKKLNIIKFRQNRLNYHNRKLLAFKRRRKFNFIIKRFEYKYSLSSKYDRKNNTLHRFILDRKYNRKLRKFKNKYKKFFRISKFYSYGKNRSSSFINKRNNFYVSRKRRKRIFRFNNKLRRFIGKRLKLIRKRYVKILGRFRSVRKHYEFVRDRKVILKNFFRSLRKKGKRKFSRKALISLIKFFKYKSNEHRRIRGKRRGGRGSKRRLRSFYKRSKIFIW